MAVDEVITAARYFKIGIISKEKKKKKRGCVFKIQISDRQIKYLMETLCINWYGKRNGEELKNDESIVKDGMAYKDGTSEYRDDKL